MRRLLAKHTPMLIGLLFLYSGIYKLLYPGEATIALIALDLGEGLASAAILAVTILELYLGMILVLRIDLKYGLGMATALMFVFAVFLAYLSAMAHPPSCGCMGLMAVFRSNRHNALLGLFRNVVVLWLLKWAYDYYFTPPAAAQTQATPR